MSSKGRYVKTKGGSYRDRETGHFVTKKAWEKERKALSKKKEEKAPVARRPAPTKGPAPAAVVEARPSPSPAPAPAPTTAPVSEPAKRTRSKAGKYVYKDGVYRDRKTGHFVSKKKWEGERKRLKKEPVPVWKPETPKPKEAPKAPKRERGPAGGVQGPSGPVISGPLAPPAPSTPARAPRDPVWPEEYPEDFPEEVEVFYVDDELYDA